MADPAENHDDARLNNALLNAGPTKEEAPEPPKRNSKDSLKRSAHAWWVA